MTLGGFEDIGTSVETEVGWKLYTASFCCPWLEICLERWMSLNETSLVLQGVWACSNPQCGQYFKAMFTFQTQTLETQSWIGAVVGDVSII